MQGDETNFGHTTISNLAATDSVLWVHIIVGIMFMPLGIYLSSCSPNWLNYAGYDALSYE